MEIRQAIHRLGALAHEHRLAAFRLLVRAGPDGLSAGDLAVALGLAPSSLSFHLAQLQGAGLVSATRAGRRVIYRLDSVAMRDLLGYLTEDCCQGRRELCPELSGALAACVEDS